jgi:hypothetical protein
MELERIGGKRQKERRSRIGSNMQYRVSNSRDADGLWHRSNALPIWTALSSDYQFL